MHLPAGWNLRPVKTVCLVIAALIIAWALTQHRHPTPPGGYVAPPPATPTEATATSVSTTSATPTVTATQAPAGSPGGDATWRPLAARFLTAYLAGPDGHRKAWLAQMTRDCTPALAAGLAAADPARLPTGTVTDLTITTVDEMAGGTATATLSTGRGLDLTVVRLAGRLAIADVEWSQ